MQKTRNESNKSNNVQASRGELWVVGQLALLAAILLAPSSEEWPDGLRTISMIAGVVIGIIGLLVIAMGGARLGSSLTIFPRPVEHGKLARQGIYRVVRHPMYFGVILSTLGWVMLSTSTLGLILILVLGVFFDAKSRREEIWLVEKYPDYETYRRDVRKLIPWIY